MSKILLQTRLKNLIKKNTNLEFEYHLHPISINGQKRGCSGFIRNPENNLIIYVDTEHCIGPLSGKMMYRYAENLHDFSGGINQFANTEDELAKKIVYHLESEVHYFD